MPKKSIAVFPLIFLILSACNLPSGSQEESADSIFTLAAQTVTAAALTEQVATSTPEETQTPIATLTETPSGAAASTVTTVPCNLASFVADVTIPDDSSITVNNAFTKTWRLRNAGSCTWTSGYQIIFDSGDQMGGPASQQLTAGTVAPGQTVDVSVNLTAPNSPGTYKGNWRLRDPNGVVFALAAGPFWVQIKATAAPAANTPEASWPIVKVGDQGVEVYTIQYLLRANGLNLNPDGIFGPQTRARVEDFQTQKNLAKDGIVGPQTWSALIVQVQQGSSGDAVRAVQMLLKDKFGYNITVDGIFGPNTADAVKSFQTSKGLTSDGIVGPITWRNLVSK
jgi:hypothetical protein